MDTDFQVLDWFRMLLGAHPPLYFLEIAFKAVAVFLILLLVLRMMGKRSQQNISPMQHLLLIALGSAAGDAMLYPEISVGYAALVLLGMTLLVVLLEMLNERFRPVRDYVEARPRVLVRNGRIDEAALQMERTTKRELHAALRGRGARSLQQVRYAILEVTGEISVFLDERTPEREDLILHVLEQEHGEGSARHRSR